MISRFRAYGRQRPGQMNKTEARYALELEARKRLGEILWYRYEGIKLKLADKTFLTPDFFVLMADGQLEIHEVKGYMEDDANVKIKVCAELYPFLFKVIRVAKGGGGRWHVQEI